MRGHDYVVDYKTKLTDDQIASARDKFNTNQANIKELALRYNIAYDYMRRIVRNLVRLPK